RQGWRLAPMLLPYLVLVGIGATAADHLPGRVIAQAAPAVWLDLHVLVSVATYGLLTNAAVAGFAVFLQERALKRRQPGALISMLPAVAEAELLQIRLLVATAVVLGLGLLTGAATQYAISGTLIVLNHKTMFALLAFVIILAILVAHYRTGLRGRRAARVVLLAWLLLTLAYPGVKFVTDVLLA
ncbi:MAG: cytochrome c biogenesis protein CcsA, partial [Dongiaceae bacterium]